MSNSDSNPQVNTFFVNENMYGIQNLPSSLSISPTTTNNNNTIISTTASHNNHNPTYHLLHVIPNKSMIRKSLSLDTTSTQNMNANLLNLNATTVISSNSPSFSSTSRGANFYHYYQHHRPEDLSRFLKEVGPNVQVQVS